MNKLCLALLAGLLFVLPACSNQSSNKAPDNGALANARETPRESTDKGIIALRSAYSVEETAKRLVSGIDKRGLKLFTQIDHAGGAKSVGKQLRPTQVVIFGNPKVGTPLMQCDRTVAIDLPQKALIWEDESGQVWLGYNDPNYLKTRHNLNGCEAVIKKIEQVLNTLATEATQS